MSPLNPLMHCSDVGKWVRAASVPLQIIYKQRRGRGFYSISAAKLWLSDILVSPP